jgi:competence protein ComEC
MLRDILNSTIQKKFFLMFFTSVIYITGLIAYFTNNEIWVAFLLLILGILSIFKNYLSPKLVLFWYFIFFFAFFNADLRIQNFDELYLLAPQNATIEGRIVSIPSENIKNTRKFFLQASNIYYNGKNKHIKAKTLVTLKSEDENFSEINIGNVYKIRGKLRIPYKASNPSQFDYARYLKNFGVFTTFYANKNDCHFNKTKLTFKWQFQQGLNNIRNNIIKTQSQYLKSPNLEVLGGIVFGDDAIAPPEYVKTSFTHSGLLHILAASGMNVALIYGIWFFILRKFKVPFNVTLLSGIFIVIFYTMMTGLGPSVIRAAFMLIFILIGKLIDRDAHSISLLSFVALLMLIYNPAYINDIGFQLSFLVTFGLLMTAPVIFEKFKKIPNWALSAVFIPVIAQIWVAPIQMYYFNSFSLYSILANIAILPFLTILSFGGFISTVLALIKPFASKVCFIFSFILNPILNVLIFISDFFAKLPNSLMLLPQPNIFQIFLYYGIILLIIFFFKFGKNKNITILTVIVALILVISFFPKINNNFETIAFDVQNADAFLIKTPQNKYFIIDSGKMGYNGGKTQAKTIILEYLKDNNIKNIEGLIITHFDSDHAGGAIDLIENLNIKNVYVNSLNDNAVLALKIYKSIKNNKQTQIKSAQNNSCIYIEENKKMNRKFVIKNFIADLKGSKFENENSIITLVSDNDFDELFMGDAGIIAFNKIKNDLPTSIEVLKVGHHGAKNVMDQTFLDCINPQVAIISTGFNTYGHPNPVILTLLNEYNIKTFRTDKHNAIKISELNNSYDVSSYNNKWNKNFSFNYSKIPSHLAPQKRQCPLCKFSSLIK